MGKFVGGSGALGSALVPSAGAGVSPGRTFCAARVLEGREVFKVRFGGTPKPALGTSALSGSRAARDYEPMPSSKLPPAGAMRRWSQTKAMPLALVVSRSRWALSASTTRGAVLVPWSWQ